MSGQEFTPSPQAYWEALGLLGAAAGTLPPLADWEKMLGVGPDAAPEPAAVFRRLQQTMLQSPNHLQQPLVRVAPWPGNKPFALWLSHDVDQLHDREFFRILADFNHLRRTLIGTEPGRVGPCLRRIVRSGIHPRNARLQFQRIRDLERRHGWPSTFFFLEGYRGRRYGTRYALDDPSVRSLGQWLLEEGCEIGVHGAFYDFNCPEGYRRSAERVGRAFGVTPVGIRNHMLRWSYPDTWSAQAAAGFLYDSTFAHGHCPGYRNGFPFPFRTPCSGPGERAFWELPLLLMDTTLFRRQRLQGSEATDRAVAIVDRAVASGGLISLLWHNNYFLEEEYADWESTYGTLLEHLAGLHPWCATGVDIARWWSHRSSLDIRVEPLSSPGWRITVEAGAAIEHVVILIEAPSIPGRIELPAGGGRGFHTDGTWAVHFTRLEPGRPAHCHYFKNSA